MWNHMIYDVIVLVVGDYINIYIYILYTYIYIFFLFCFCYILCMS